MDLNGDSLNGSNRTRKLLAVMKLNTIPFLMIVIVFTCSRLFSKH